MKSKLSSYLLLVLVLLTVTYLFGVFDVEKEKEKFPYEYYVTYSHPRGTGRSIIKSTGLTFVSL